MYSANEVLKYAERIVVTFDARVDNTAKTEWDFADWNCGNIESGGFNNEIAINNNSAVRLTSGQAKNSGGSDVIESGLLLNRTLSENFGSGTARSLGALSVEFRNGLDQLHFRDWDKAPFEIKVGGRVHGDIMRYEDYPTYIIGRSEGHDYDESNLQVAISTSPPELDNLFPLNTYTSGIAKGEVIPFVIGHVRNLAPVDLGGGLYQFHDGECEGVVTAYDQGTELTLEAGDPLTDTPTTGNYMADQNGYIKALDSDDVNLTIEAKGAKIDGSYSNLANICLTEVIGLATKLRVPVTHGFDGSEIGWVFRDQKPIRNHASEVLSGLDCYFIEIESDNSIEIKRRYNGEYRDADGNANIRNSFDFSISDIIQDSITRISTEFRPQSTKIHYNKNWDVVSGRVLAAHRKNMKTELYSSAYLNASGTDLEREVVSPLTSEDDADALAESAAARDGARNHNYSLSLHGVGHGFTLGDIGEFNHFLLPSGYAEIRSITENTSTRKTDLTVVIYG